MNSSTAMDKLSHSECLRIQYETVYGGYDKIPERILWGLECLAARENGTAEAGPSVYSYDFGYETVTGSRR